MDQQQKGYSNKTFWMCFGTMRSSVTLGDSLDLILLLHGVGVGLTDTLGGGNNLVSQVLGHWFVGSERGLSGTLGHKVDSLVDSSHWGHINSLSSNGTTGTDSCGVFSGSSLHDGFEQNLEWVLSSGEVNDLKGSSENSHSLLFFTILSMMTNHESIGESLSDWALNLLETFFLVLTSSVWDVHLGLDGLNGKVWGEGLLWALDSFIWPLTKKLWGDSEFDSIFNVQFWLYNIKNWRLERDIHK